MAFFSKKPAPPYIAAVVTAVDWQSGGQSLFDITPIVARSIGTLNDCVETSEIVIVCLEEDMADYYDLAMHFGFDKIVSVVKSMDTRQASVFAGINACSAHAEYFVMHDGLYSLVTEYEIVRCVETAMQTGAAATGVGVRGNVKICGENGGITSAMNRGSLWTLQSPQVFQAALYRRAMAAALCNHRVYSGDCEMMEGFGHKVSVSEGSYENIKITAPEDIAAADAILNMREGMFDPWHSFV